MALNKNLTVQVGQFDGEFQVDFFMNGIKLEDLTYFTDDRQDAFETKKAMEKEIPGMSNHLILSKIPMEVRNG